MLIWEELINQMRAVGDELRTESGDLGELGELIDGWADKIEGERSPDAVTKAVQAAKAFHPVKQSNG